MSAVGSKKQGHVRDKIYKNALKHEIFCHDNFYGNSFLF